MNWIIKSTDQVMKEAVLVLIILSMVGTIVYLYTEAKDIEVPFKENIECNRNYIITN